MQNFTIKKYTSADQPLWDHFVSNAKNSTFLFYRDFMEYHSDRFKDYSLMILKGEELFALLPANRLKNELFSHQGLSYGGFLLNAKAQFQDIVNAFQVLLWFIDSEGITSLHIKSLPLIYHKNLNQEISFLLSALKAEVEKNESYYVIENLERYKPNRNRKRAIKLAKEQEVQIKKEGDLVYFWKHILTNNLLNKFGVNPVHSVEEIQYLKSRFPNQIQFFSAEKDGSIHAGVVMFISDQVAHFQYSSGDDMRSENGALDILFHYIIERFKHKKYISFGSSSTDRTYKIDKGLAYWKESFGAKLISQKSYKIEVKNYKYLNSIFK